MYSTYESTVKEIIGIDGVLYDFVEQVEPADPPDGAGLVAIERWKTARKKYEAADDKRSCKIVWCIIRSNVRGVTNKGEQDAFWEESHGGV